MTTATNFFKRLIARKDAKKNPDWARVEEPDRFDMVTLSLIGIIITAFLILLAQIVLTNNMVEVTAYYLASFDTAMTFNERLAALGVGLITFINLFITMIFVLFAPVSNDDIVEMISDMDANTQERFVELENNVTEHLNRIALDE
jgi:hypothetical protein